MTHPLDPDSLHAQISDIAYGYFLDRGAVDDPEASVEDWLRAEAYIQQLRNEKAGVPDLPPVENSGSDS